jgi:anti-sigma regulatory factor (Ser/Thr protein kinase)
VSGSSVVLLPHTPASVATARSQISAQLRQTGIIPPAIGDAALVVSELLSNSILHARPLPGARVQLAWLLRGETLEVAVSDGGSVTRPRPAPASLTATGGRGLAVVDCLARSWGVHTGQAWTTVWAVLPAPGGRRNRPG